MEFTGGNEFRILLYRSVVIFPRSIKNESLQLLFISFCSFVLNTKNKEVYKWIFQSLATITLGLLKTYFRFHESSYNSFSLKTVGRKDFPSMWLGISMFAISKNVGARSIFRTGRWNTVPPSILGPLTKNGTWNIGLG